MMACRHWKRLGYNSNFGKVASVLERSASVLVIAAEIAVLVISIGLASNSGKKPAEKSSRARRLEFEVIKDYPHDPEAFLQGLLWHDGYLYESTGLNGQSSLRQVDLTTGKVLKLVRLSPEFFGEGLAAVDSRLIQLTWTSKVGLVYDLNTFTQLRRFIYQTEGWGLTYDGRMLIMSDGSSYLSYLDPVTFTPGRRLAVKMNGQPVRNLNELEFIEGKIWANVWQTDRILCIDPVTGQADSYLALSGILPDRLRTGREDVLNGIAYDAQRKRIFVSGKLWPRLFEIRVK